ncbi:MAG: choice-of-anchor J domain-containing protein [Bacteroidales bacterium]|jgi:hypothetical protein|nr:choice-of-anchor J domain-containing protein [Bacteroidales bacterium]
MDANRPNIKLNITPFGTLFCYTPTELNITNKQTNSATASWQSAQNASSYTVEYKLNTATTWTVANNAVVDTFYNITGLASASGYDVRVKTNCSATNQSEYIEGSFRTQCQAVATPYTYGFEEDWVSGSGISNRNAPPCWTVLDGGVQNASDSYFWMSESNEYYTVHGGNKCAGIYTDYAQAQHNDWLITPKITLTGNNRLTFYAQRANEETDEPEEISVWISTNATIDTTGLASGNALSGFTQLIQTEIPQGAWRRYEVNLSEYSGDAYIAFVRRNTPYDGYRLLLDDVTIDSMPDCPGVYNTSLSLVSQSSINVNFDTINSKGMGWIIAYGTANDSASFNPSTVANPITITSSTQLPYEITGLNANTTYYVSVKQNCGGGQWSNYVSEFIPNIKQVTIPYTQHFDTTNVKEITFIANDSINKWYIGNATNADTNNTTSGALYISNNNGTNNTATYPVGNWASTPYSYAQMYVKFPQGKEFHLDFDYKNEGGYLNVYCMDVNYKLENTNIPNYEYRLRQYTDSNTWKHDKIVFDSTNSNTYKKIIFLWYAENGWDDAESGIPAAIDNIDFTNVSCAKPNELHLVTKDTSKAVVAWHDINLSGSYVVEYKQSTTDLWSRMVASDTIVTITGLIPSTEYDVRVYSKCTANDSSLISSSISFYTECSYQTIPYIEDFTSNVVSSTCWSTYQGQLTNNSSLTNYDYYSWAYNQTEHNVRLNIYGTSCNYWLVTPTINLGTDGITKQIELDVALKAYSGDGEPQTAGTDDKFAIVVSRDNGLTWSDTNAYIWKAGDSIRNYYSFGVNSQHLVIPLYDSVQNVPIQGLIKIAFYGESTVSNNDNNIFISNLDVNNWNSCIKPTSLAVTHKTDTSFVFGFTENGTATSWQYVIGNYGMDPDNGTPVNITSTTDTIIGLTPATRYTLSVRSICGNGYSEWSNPIDIKTTSIPATLPYVCDFENATENNNWAIDNGGCINKWYIATPNGVNGSKLFVSFNGTDTTYDESSASVVVAERLLNMGTADSVSVSFDLKIGGEASEYGKNYDYLKVYLLDQDTTYSSTTSYNVFYANEEYSNNIIVRTSIEDKYICNLQPNTIHLGNIVHNQQNKIKKLVFVWVNDGSQGNQPGAIIDNISVVPVMPSIDSVVTEEPTEVEATTATLNGNLISLAKPKVNVRLGFVLSTTNNPELTTAGIENDTVGFTPNMATFNKQITNLQSATPYYYRAYVINNNDTTYGQTKIFTTKSGLLDVENNVNISIYPNPTTNDATLEVKGLKEKANVVMIDVQGRVVSSQVMALGQTTLTIKRNNLASGVYYIRVITDNQTRTEKLIIK